MSLTTLVPKPSPESVNTGLSPLHVSTMERILGRPALLKLSSCQPVIGKLRKGVVTMDVGPFKVTGHRVAVSRLRVVLDRIKRERPVLWGSLGTAGMLCARKVRGGSSWSNHSWGMAIDLTILGNLDTRGDNMVQQGLLDCYPYFHAEGWYWGTEFTTEDSMHFELANETVLRAEAMGEFK